VRGAAPDHCDTLAHARYAPMGLHDGAVDRLKKSFAFCFRSACHRFDA
jgi:hypothetical protein